VRNGLLPSYQTLVALPRGLKSHQSYSIVQLQIDEHAATALSRKKKLQLD